MTEKEKAKELVDKFTEMMEQTLDVSYPYSAVENIDLAAKKASLISVDEIINLDSGDAVDKDFWEEVKKEIKLI